MLYELDAIMGSPVMATDGEIGSVRSFLFDDQSWKVGYLVVSAGNWLKLRDVVVPITALDKPDFTSKTCCAHLTREQVRKSPDMDAEKPFSCRKQMAMLDSSGAPATWVDPEYNLSSIPAERQCPALTVKNFYLRNTTHMLGYHVRAIRGEMGIVQGLVMDDTTWRLSYLDVKEDCWHKSLVSTRWVESVSWAKLQINLHRTRADNILKSRKEHHDRFE